MLDQPVPNPLAKNPKVHTHKVFAAVGLILIGTIIAVAGIWYYLDRQAGAKDAAEKTTTTKVATSSAKPSVDETATWKVLANTQGGFSLKYPNEWLSKSILDGEPCNADHTFLSPNQEALGVCASGVGGIISITRTPVGTTVDQVFPNYQEHSFTNRTDADLQLDAKNAQKITGISNLVSLTDDFVGHRFIIYLVDLGDRTLIIQYNQPPDFPDHSAEFEKIVESIKFI